MTLMMRPSTPRHMPSALPGFPLRLQELPSMPTPKGLHPKHHRGTTRRRHPSGPTAVISRSLVSITQRARRAAERNSPRALESRQILQVGEEGRLGSSVCNGEVAAAARAPRGANFPQLEQRSLAPLARTPSSRAPPQARNAHIVSAEAACRVERAEPNLADMGRCCARLEISAAMPPHQRLKMSRPTLLPSPLRPSQLCVPSHSALHLC
mmetsp:Transcript_70620/g.229424  ORF Transcript_70620/g.229424 Transcript_70620/m.229424 type:complete len:210 (-) Transcript_70620:96-725(-)